MYLDSGNVGLPLANEALKYVSSAGGSQLNKIRSVINNTKSKRMATQAHKKLTKDDRQRASHQQLQRRTLATINPRRMLQIAIANTKQKLEICRRRDVAEIEPDVEPDVEIAAPRAKKSRLTSNELEIFTSEERRQIIYNDIRLPRTVGGNVVYSATEAVNVVNALIRQNSKLEQPHPERTLLVLIKEKMINEKRIPVKICRFNRILKMTADGDSPQLHWNSLADGLTFCRCRV